MPGEIRVMMEYTGKYYQPIAKILYEEGIFVSICKCTFCLKVQKQFYSQGKPDKLDVIEIANYCLEHWIGLPEYIPENEYLPNSQDL